MASYLVMNPQWEYRDSYDIESGYLRGGEKMDPLFAEKYAALKAVLGDARVKAQELVKSREGSLIVTKIEEALLWLHAAKAVEESK